MDNQGLSFSGQVLRAVLIVVAVAVGLYLVFLLRTPISWILIAAFIAVALTGPVNFLARFMRRGAAITVVYLGLFLVPVGVLALVIPPLVDEGSNLVDELPSYAREAREYVEDNKRLREFEADYDVFQNIEEEANKLPGRAGDAAGTVSDIGLGLVNSIFALVNILVLAAFMLTRGSGWVRSALDQLEPMQRERVQRVLDRASRAISGYVAGALLVASVAGVSTFVVLTILGVPFSAPLALLAAFFSLIPLIGATIAAALIAIVTLFSDFPTATIVWVIWAVIYQQVENNVIQARIQARTVQVGPFVVLVAVLFGGFLLGILGALVAIPVAATLQVALNEWWNWRRGLAHVELPTGVEAPIMPPGVDPARDP